MPKRIEPALTIEEAQQRWPQIPVNRAENLTNKRFGTLLCLYRTNNDNHKQTQWVCQCDCGNIKPVRANYFNINNKNVSCGCLNNLKASQRMLKYNLEQQQIIPNGSKFGKLTVIQYLGFRKQKSRNKNVSYYLCQCDCGSAPVEIMGNSLLVGHTLSCGCLHSYGEEKIKHILDDNNIKYKTEYQFDNLVNLKTNTKLRFDFAILDKNNKVGYLIEYDGRQHYTGPEAKWSHHDSLEEIQYRDNLKNQYCMNNNIPLIRIPYTHLNIINIQDLLLDSTNYLNKG